MNEVHAFLHYHNNYMTYATAHFFRWYWLFYSQCTDFIMFPVEYWERNSKLFTSLSLRLSWKWTFMMLKQIFMFRHFNIFSNVLPLMVIYSHSLYLLFTPSLPTYDNFFSLSWLPFFHMCLSFRPLFCKMTTIMLIILSFPQNMSAFLKWGTRCINSFVWELICKQSKDQPSFHRINNNYSTQRLFRMFETSCVLIILDCHNCDTILILWLL